MDVKIKCQEEFKKHFAQDPKFMSYAPGRVNIIGEHTDYNDGFVMPCAIKYGTAIVAKENNTNKIRALAVDIDGDTDEFELSDNIQKHESKTWSNYLRGVATLIMQKGYKLKGLDIAICGDVPLGAGLSSSASLEVSFGTLLSNIFNLNIKPQDIALIGQAAEAYIGCKCGIMDQTISACGTKDHSLMIDCRSLELKQVKLPSDLVVLIINSNVKHALVGGEYNERREQCENAAKILNVKALRDATLDMLEDKKSQMDDLTYKRALHVITENQRVLDSIDAFVNGNLHSLAKFMYASHCSMRDNFEITIPEINALVEIVRCELGEENAAVRMTGGGFGGSVVALVKPNDVQKVKDAVNKYYRPIAMRDATIFETHATDGASFIQL